ncbi:PDR/VanB family oxidoreductase [Phyllobacterium sp. LjRoot231]|uniref:PDR/VanB family oxidoreductase n=1 Tax=Phyllobacterium sp. LjRoot231 TaxID=3342289 RepID=UPI003ECC4891
MEAVPTKTITMRLMGIQYLAHETNLYEFEPVDGVPIPAAGPGAHVDIHLPNGMIRPYSLVHSGEDNRYTIGVKRDAAGRGGSACLHDTVRVGAVLTVGVPRNNFPLVETADHTVLIAGGIGITPIWCMAERLQELGRSFELHYACRDRRDVAFLDRLEQLSVARIHIDAEAGGFLDLCAIIDRAPAGSHLYCCGPTPMLDAFEATTRGLDPAHVHLERFGPVEEVSREGGFVVALEKSGREFTIPEGKSILEVLRDAGLDVDFSCEQGICGACQVQVVDGEPDHRDMFLSDEEKAEGSMMICCSGSKTERLTLAL